VSFELKDMIAVVQTELTSYASWFTSAVRSPRFMAHKAIEWQPEPVVNKEFLTILVVSAFVGATVGSVIPDRPPLKDRFTVAVIVVLAWLLVSSVTHAAVRVLHTHRPIGVTVQAMMQVLALAYVVSCFAGLLVSGVRASLPAFDSWMEDGDFGSPGDVIVIVQFIAILFYLPLVLGAAHGGKGIVAGAAGVGVVGASFAAIISLLLVSTGSC
jgi:hypothetical protein